MRYTLLFICTCYCSLLTAQQQKTKQDNSIILENKKIALTFDRQTGELLQMINKKTKDNYIKTAIGGNLFRLFINTGKMAPLTAGAHDHVDSGIIVDPAGCRLKKFTRSRKKNSTTLQLHIQVSQPAIEALVKISLPDTAAYFDCSLSVTNYTDNPCSIYSSLPYFSGISLGNTPATNLAVNMWDRGYPGIKAWKKNSGGVYGKDVSMQWQCVYEPAMNEGLAFITMDTAFSNKILTCFPGGGMQSLYFDSKTLSKGTSYTWPATLVVIFNGNWRVAAQAYREWAQTGIKPRTAPLSYTKDVAMRTCTWIPSAETISKNKADARPGSFTSFTDLFSLYKNDVADCLELAMWNEDVVRFPETYGPWMSSGFLGFRSDLGGLPAFEAGVKKVHQYGRKVAMYVAGYAIRTSSPLFTNDSWKKNAIIDQQGEIYFGYKDDEKNKAYGIFNCLGYKPWQDNIIRVCKMLAKAGVDEIRLDEIGFPFKPCFNTEHHHASPYDTQLWTREYLRRVREAVDSINPQLVISTEFFMDYFHTYTNGALVMDCSGSELDAMKIALPQYIAMSYHAGAAESMLTGAIMSKTTAYRQDWAWPHVGTERPANYPEGTGPSLPYYELYASFAEAFVNANPTDKDPVAPGDTLWTGHVWKNEKYWILTGGHEDASSLPVKTLQVLLPGLPDQFTHAIEYDVQTLEAKPIQIQRDKKHISIPIHHPLSLVFFPAPSCAPLPLIEQMPAKVKAGTNMQLAITLYAPWNPSLIKKNINAIKLQAPGYKVSQNKIDGNTIFYSVEIPADAQPGKYFIAIRDSHCMPLKRWFQVE